MVMILKEKHANIGQVHMQSVYTNIDLTINSLFCTDIMLLNVIGR